MRRFWLPLALALALMTVLGVLASGMGSVQAAADGPSVQVAQDPRLGTILTDPNGKTLYMFTKDSPGVSNCYDQCAANWPPLLVKEGEQPIAPVGMKGTLGTAARKDGTLQLTYNGWPLYYWVKDKAPGDTTGQNVNNVWFVLNPDAPTVMLAKDPTMGTLLTDPTGMTLYVFTKDLPGTTNCYGQCAVNWPPLVLREGELLNAPPGLGGTLGTTTRKDGSRQVTLNGAPLYYWVKDKAPGEATGHKVNGVWFVAEPGLLLDTAGTWSQSQVSKAVRDGWVKGHPDGTFRPNDQVTHAEFITMVTAAFGSSTSAILADFGNEPGAATTREEATVILARVLGLTAEVPVGLSRFSDAGQIGAQNAPLVSAAIQAGVILGYPDNTIHGERAATRAEAVVLILRALALKK